MPFSLPGQHSPNDGSQISPGGRQLGGRPHFLTPPWSWQFFVQHISLFEQSSPIGLQPPMLEQKNCPGCTCMHAFEQHWLGPLHASPTGLHIPASAQSFFPPTSWHKLPQQSAFVEQICPPTLQPSSG
jgi:hypothetical protein